jgi:hypothetical protein
VVEARFKFGGDLRAFLFVRFLTGFAAKVMVKVPSANQSKTSATVIAACLHDVPEQLFRPWFQPIHSQEKVIWREA